MSQITQADSIREAIPLLRRPFTKAAVKWKVQVNPLNEQGNALVVAFIDARLAGERLNAICPDLWSDEYLPVDGGLRCTLTLREQEVSPAPARSIVRSDVGWSKGTGSDMDLKALYSDAFKRACVKLGIGVSIYALPQQWLSAKDGEVKKVGQSGWAITNKGLVKLRANYEAWLKKDGKTFGDPIDHGDVLDSQGDAETRERGVAVEGDAAEEKPKATRQRKEQPKAEEAGAEDKPADTAIRRVSERGLEAIVEALILSTKSGDDVTNWLTAKGIEGANLDAILPTLTADQAKDLHAWLKANRQDGAAVAVGA